MNKKGSEHIRRRAEEDAEEKAERRLRRWTDRTVKWIRAKVSEAGCTGVVIGLSGGLDSAVVAALCQRAFPEEARAVFLPVHSLEADRNDAEKVAKILGIKFDVIALDDVFDQFLEVLPPADEASEQLAKANLKPRLRMAALYYVAAVHNSLVVGTGNRAEIYLGYFTKYGDGATDIMPLARLTKAQVVRVGQYLGIPDEVINRSPSAGLWPGQTDEDELGISYNQIDAFLLRGAATTEVADKIRSLHKKTEHKRHPPPLPPFTLSEGAVSVEMDPEASES